MSNNKEQTTALSQEDIEPLFYHGRSIRYAITVISSVAIILSLSGMIDVTDYSSLQFALWPIRILVISISFLAIIPSGYFGVELAFGAGRTTRILTKDGPTFRWPWMVIMLVDQRIISSRRSQNYQVLLGEITLEYEIQFRASPDIRDEYGRNKFIEQHLSDPTLNKLNQQINYYLEHHFYWFCRSQSIEKFRAIDFNDTLTLFGLCVLKLPQLPHKNEAIIDRKLISDDQVLSFYKENRNGILERYPKKLLRPILNVDVPKEYGRYRGVQLDQEGNIINAEFMSKLSEVEKLHGVEVMDFRAKVYVRNER